MDKNETDDDPESVTFHPNDPALAVLKEHFERMERRFQFKTHDLDADHNVIEVSLFEAFVNTFNTNNVVDVVAQDQLTNDIYVSTVFLGRVQLISPHNERRPLLLFETMIMGGPHNGHTIKTATWDEAVRAHEAAKQIAAV